MKLIIKKSSMDQLPVHFVGEALSDSGILWQQGIEDTAFILESPISSQVLSELCEHWSFELVP